MHGFFYLHNSPPDFPAGYIAAEQVALTCIKQLRPVLLFTLEDNLLALQVRLLALIKDHGARCIAKPERRLEILAAGYYRGAGMH
jgi:hypothetical protein